jgi:hypothetical protein
MASGRATADSTRRKSIRAQWEGRAVIIRLTIQQDGAGFRATISKRDDQGNGIIGHPEIFLVDDKEEAKKRAKDLARGLGLKTYRVVDRTLKV